MTTGAKFAALPLKSLLGFGDLSTRFLQYLKQGAIDATKARWDVDGVFASKLSLASAGVSKFSISGTSRATDGIGNLLDVTQIGEGNSLYATTLFENTLSITYYVGLKYCEVPDGVRVNPRSGVPEYISYREEVGVSGVPNALSIVGSTLVFTVDSVTESGVSNAGRYVLVYKNVPGDLAVNDNLALPDPIAVTWDGSNNKVTATLLGQSTPSASVADYTVVLIGPAVKRNTNLITAPGYVFLSTIVGAGATNPPGAFDNSAQQLLVTFEDADVVRTELEAYEAAVLSNSTPGSSLVGVAPSAYAARKPVVDPSAFTTVGVVGLGNQADGTLPANARLSDVLLAVNKQLSRIRAWTGTASQGVPESTAEISDGDLSNAARSGGSFFLKRLGAYIVSGAYQARSAPFFFGEIAPVAPDGLTPARPTLTSDRGASRNSLQPGRYERLFLKSGSSTKPLSLNGSAVEPGGVISECVVAAAQLDIDGADKTVPLGYKPFRIEDSLFDSNLDGITSLVSGSMTFGVGGAGSPAHGIVENVVFLGPNPSQFTPVAVAVVHLTSGLGDPLGLAAGIDNDGRAGTQDRPLVFRNCIFISQRVDTFCAKISTKQKVVFDNCHFYGLLGQTATLFSSDVGSNVTLRDCAMYSPEGQFLNMIGTRGTISNLVMVSGTGTAVANPRAVVACGATNSALKMIGVTLNIDAANVRNVGSLPIVQLGRNGVTYGITEVDGLRINYKAGLGLHGAETLLLFGRDSNCDYANIQVDFNGARPTNDGTNNASVAWPTINSAAVAAASPSIGALSRPKVRNLSIKGLKNPLSANVNMAIFAAIATEIDGLKIDKSWVSGDAQWYAHAHLFTECVLKEYSDDCNNINPSGAVLYVNGDRNRISGVRLGASTVTLGGSIPPALGVVYVNGNSNELNELLYNASATDWGSWQVLLPSQKSNYSDWNCTFANASVNPIYLSGSFQSLKASYLGWNATTANCLQLGGSHCVVTGNRFQQLAGASANLVDAGAGNLTTGNVISP